MLGFFSYTSQLLIYIKEKISLSVGVSSLKKKINKKVLNSLTHLMLASFCMEFLLKKKKKKP